MALTMHQDRLNSRVVYNRGFSSRETGATRTALPSRRGQARGEDDINIALQPSQQLTTLWRDSGLQSRFRCLVPDDVYQQDDCTGESNISQIGSQRI
jgi:hypothetical protein